MIYFYMVLAITFSVLSNMILHKFKNRCFRTPGDVFLFNAGISIVWFFVLLIWILISKEFLISFQAVIYGIVYGIILCLFLYFKNQSMSEGPVALTSLIGNCAFIIATWFGVFYSNETILPLQFIGMVVIVIALIMCIKPKKGSEKLTIKWFVWCSAFFFAGGLLGIFNKIFGKSDVSNQVNSMMMVASVVSAVLFIGLAYFVNNVSKCEKPQIYKKSLSYVVSCGIVGCVYIRINLWLAGVIPSVIFFPISNGANVLLSTLLGWLLFKEKFNKIQLIGIFTGLGAILLIGCPQLFI